MLVGWLCLASHRQRGHLETAPPFTFPSKDVKLDFYTFPTGNRTPGTDHEHEIYEMQISTLNQGRF